MCRNLIGLLPSTLGHYVSRKSHQSIVRHQDSEEGSHHQKGRSSSHDDGKESFTG